MGEKVRTQRKCKKDKMKKGKRKQEKGKSVWCVSALCTVLSDLMGHPQSSQSGTSVLWVSTGTHQCVDPPKQGGGSTMRQPSAAALLLHCDVLTTQGGITGIGLGRLLG